MRARRGLTSALALLALAAVAGAQTAIIREVVVNGNQRISRDAIIAVMRMQAGKPYIDSDRARDIEAIMELGFFRDADIIPRQINATDWQLNVEIKENPLVKEFRITGSTVFKTEEILAVIKQPVNEVFNLRNIVPTANAIRELYQKKGYFAEAEIAPLDESPETLGINVVERAVKEIKITNQGKTRQGVIRRLLKTKPGTAFNEVTWANDRRRIESTTWFKEIEAGVEPTEEIGKFNLLLDLKEDKTGQIAFGAALDPNSRLAGSVRYSDSNFRGQGQTVSFNMQQDTVGTGLSSSIDYIDPYYRDSDTQLSIRLYSRIVNYFAGAGIGTGTNSPNDKRFDERRTGAGISLSRTTKDIFSFGYGVNYEKINTINLRNADPDDFIQQDGDLLTFSFTGVRDRRDVPLAPSEGDYVRVSIEPAFANISKIGGSVGGFNDLLGRNKFVRSNLEYKLFLSKRPAKAEDLLKPRKVLALRARYGLIVGTPPFFEQLFLGGSDSLRGYPDQRFWGKQSLLTTIEYRVPIQKTFSVIGFADYGGAWGGYGTIRDFQQSNKPNLKLGYGAGVAFNVGPLGNIRIDLGFDDRGRNRTHFSIGGSF
ncbi:MAG: BamA/TamA family outer membrane protein [Chthonomonas sp.]|nr:BamA/TamA family outer membrane protein [Chthonomonas sp.]